MVEMSEVEKTQMARETKRNNVPLQEIFGSLPIVCSGGAYGNIDIVGKSREIIVNEPFVAYTETEMADEGKKELLKLFRENVGELEASINKRLGPETVKVEIKSESYGNAPPRAHVIRFRIKENVVTSENVQTIFGAIWDEFKNYAEKIK